MTYDQFNYSLSNVDPKHRYIAEHVARSAAEAQKAMIEGVKFTSIFKVKPVQLETRK